MPALNRTASVAQIVGESGAMPQVFPRQEIDDFRRASPALVPARRERPLDPDDAFPQLEDAIAAAADQTTLESPDLQDGALVAHIVDHHHAYARRALPYVVALLAKVAGSHGKRNAKLSALCDVGAELADALDDQLDQEEREVFPAFLASGSRPDVLRDALERMFRHHGDVRMLLMRIRWLADGFVTPEWGDRSYQILMEELDALEEDVMEHMHLERFVLVPRLATRYLKAR